MIRRHGTGLRFALMALDATLAVAIALATFAVTQGAAQMAAPHDPGLTGLLLLPLYAVAWVQILAARGLYHLRARWSIRSEAVAVSQAVAILGLGTFVTITILGLRDWGYAFALALPVLAVASILGRGALRGTLREARRRGRNLRSMVIVGTGPSAVAFDREVAAHWDLGLHIDGFLGSPIEGAALGNRYLGEIDRLPMILHERVIDEVAICLPLATREQIDELCDVSMSEGKTVRIPTELPARVVSAAHVEDLDGRPVVTLVSGPDNTVSLAAKRLIDVAGATLGLVILSPLFVGIAVWILATDGRPILFRQRRVGQHGRTFSVVKFRTMTRDADALRAALRQFNEVSGNAAFKMADDPRVTRIGRFLRRTSIDELPQLWNVLRGEMSLVGPRPHPLDDVAGYDSWHRRRLTMKPGITGLWQIAGRRDLDFDRWVRFDLEYIDHWSLWLDLRLLARTIPALIRAEGR
jgi:exopolysaccharide biosynthesis polyprenyl glycosylphosphotransferase